MTTIAQIGKSVHVKRDPRVDKLVEKQIEINLLSAQGRIVIEQGYRLLVVSTPKITGLLSFSETSVMPLAQASQIKSK
jgi:hypothetical protein